MINIREIIYKTLEEQGCNVTPDEETGIVYVIDSEGVEWDFTIPMNDAEKQAYELQEIINDIDEQMIKGAL